MAPSPVVGRSQTPRTPTRTGKKLESSSTSKLTPKDSSATEVTPRKPPKLGPPKSAAKKTDDSQRIVSPQPEQVKEKAEESGDEFSSEPYQKMALKDNDESSTGPPKNHDGASVADTTDLEDVTPEPINDNDTDDPHDINASQHNENTAHDEATQTGETVEEADDESEQPSHEPEKSTMNGPVDDAKNLADKTGIASPNTDHSDKAPSEAVAESPEHGSEDTTKDVEDIPKSNDEPAESAVDVAGDDDKDMKPSVEEPNDTEAKEGRQRSGNVIVDADEVKDDHSEVSDAVAQNREAINAAADEPSPAEEDSQEKPKQSSQPQSDAVSEIGKEDKVNKVDEGAHDEKVDSGTEDVTGDSQSRSLGGADDLSSLKGLKVQENGDILDDDGNVVGKLEEGDPADLEGYEIGDDGEILDEDGDVVGRASIFPPGGAEATKRVTEISTADKDQATDGIAAGKEDLKEEEGTYLPDINVLSGLEVQENGDILDQDGNVLGRITEGDPVDLVGMTLNEDGEILDEDGDVVGRAETVPQQIQDDDGGNQLPSLNVLEGLAVDEEGAIRDEQGNLLGKVNEGDPKDLVGRKVNADGEVLDEDGDVIGRAEVVPEAAQATDQAGAEPAVDSSSEASRIRQLEEQLKPNLDIVEGRKLNKKGNILDDEGEVLAKLVDGDAKACAGKLPNENGEILDDDGNVIGRVEVVSGEAAEEAMRAAHPSLVDELENVQDAAAQAEDAADSEAEESEEVAQDTADGAKQVITQTERDFSELEGLKVNKKGEVVNEDGDPIAHLTEGNLDDVKGKKINDKGEIVDQDGKVIGKVDFISHTDDANPDTVNDSTERPETSFLEGYKVNKKGDVLDEDGNVIARLIDGKLEDAAGKKLNTKGEVVDQEGAVIGKVELVREQEGEGEDDSDQLPPLSSLKGLTVNKSGKIVDDQGNIVGELIEGDARKVWKSGAQADNEGQFWDNSGHIIGRAKTVPAEGDGEGEFAGLENLVVVKDGWVEDESGNRVGKIVDGDPKRLVGRAVDEDGDIIDKRGNVVGHADRYEEAEADKPAAADLSELKGLTPNKQGNVIGSDGVPIARLVEGNPKELAGRKIDENGQIWNDLGKVVGRCELIPPGEREAKAEGSFAGLQGLVVVKDGYVEDGDGNIVGRISEGDARRLLGRSVDEDGDIIDKYGNVKGHAEPYEAPDEEQETPEDLSTLAGKTVNKQGKVVDEHGTIFGQVTDGEARRLAGCKVDGRGQIWSNDGKVIGHAGLIAGGDDGRAEGPFSNFESTTVSKDGLVKDSNGDFVGRVVEGDPKKLVGRRVDDDGDILDKNGNVIGKAERWEPEERTREVNLMAGLRVNKQGEVRDKNGDIVGRLTDGNLLHCIGREVNDNGYVVDQDGNKLGEVTLLENIQEDEEEVVDEGPTDEEIKKQEEKEVSNKIASILFQTIEKMEPICKDINEAVEKADRTPRDELDEEALVNKVKPLIEEGGRILSECNGSIRGLDPDGHIAAQAKARHASGEATPEEHRVAEGLKELTGSIVKCIDNAKKKIADMPHAKKKLNPLWGLLTEPLFQIIAAVGLLLTGVLGLVGRLLNGLGLGSLVNGLLGGLGINTLLDSVGLSTITNSLGLGGKKS